MCAVKYLMACTKASAIGADGACIPTFPALPSQKAKGFARGTAVIGLGGVGFVAVAPCLGNDYQCLVSTTADFAGQTVIDVAAGTETIVTSLTNLPYSSTQLSSTTNAARVNGRVVGAELSAQYTGTVFNRSGMIYAYTDANHTDVAGMSPISLGSRQNVRVVTNRGQKVSTAICAVSPDEVEYPPKSGEVSGGVNLKNQLYPYSDGNNSLASTIGNLTSVIMFTGVPGQSFQFEYHQHVEYCGGGTAGRTTPTDLDTNGFQAVNTAVNASSESTGSDPWSAAGQWLNANGYALGQAASGAAKMAAGMMAPSMNAMPDSFLRVGA